MGAMRVAGPYKDNQTDTDTVYLCPSKQVSHCKDMAAACVTNNAAGQSMIIDRMESSQNHSDAIISVGTSHGG
jgi:hypothetical protein